PPAVCPRRCRPVRTPRRPGCLPSPLRTPVTVGDNEKGRKGRGGNPGQTPVGGEPRARPQGATTTAPASPTRPPRRHVTRQTTRLPPPRRGTTPSPARSPLPPLTPRHTARPPTDRTPLRARPLPGATSHAKRRDYHRHVAARRPRPPAPRCHVTQANGARATREHARRLPVTP
ncbi:hypothetical protein FPV67DRAFT_1784577, partial [Lyophyllum atratum]